MKTKRWLGRPRKLLYKVARRGHLADAIRLLDQEVDVNEASPRGETPLYLALAHHHPRVALELVRRGADVNRPGPHGSYALHLLHWLPEESTAVTLAEEILARGAVVDALDDDGFAPLHFAVQDSRYKLAELLLSHGADINRQSFNHESPIGFAACWGHTDMARFLIQHGADVNAEEEGVTAVMRAAQWGQAGVLKLLVDAGATVSIPHPWRRQPPLTLAAMFGSAACVSLLLAAGADPAATDDDGRTALDYARDWAGTNLSQKLRDLYGPGRVKRLRVGLEVHLEHALRRGTIQVKANHFDEIVALLQTK
ncbi:MAG TPA: ankyrin repeat domain-containing protein [Candidatus Xenobia bacterium]|jgi:cytohesin